MHTARKRQAMPSGRYLMCAHRPHPACWLHRAQPWPSVCARMHHGARAIECIHATRPRSSALKG
eukprot:14050760-Alexandrium_andersonii.AAC.1